MTENNDPWANLADSLGAAPGGEPVQKPQQRVVKPSKPVETKKPGNETPAAKKSETDWGGLANQLGLESSAPELPKPEKRVEQKDGRRTAPPPQADIPAVNDGFGAGLLDDGDSMPQPSSRPPRRSNDKPRQSSRPPRSNNDVEEENPAEPEGSPESGDQTTGELGEPRRRRRGRRGGRGRGRRNDRSAQNATRTQVEGRTDDNEELPGYGRNLGGERNERDELASEPPQDHSSHAREEQEDEFAHGLDVISEQRNSENGRDPRSDSSQDDDQEQLRAGDRPPRRRRRRRRGRRTRDGEGLGNDSQRSGEEESEESDEVKVSHQPAEKPFTEHDSGGNENSDGEPRRRRRRRRRRRKSDEQSQETAGDDSSDRRSGAGDAGGQRRPDRSGGRGREARRGGDGEGRRRGTFSRVGSRREDDEEGLEFLGTEDELASSDQRDNGDDDSLSDSGLDGVRDVPSWVEAIGIVIAGNMDSRKQPPQT